MRWMPPGGGFSKEKAFHVVCATAKTTNWTGHSPDIYRDRPPALSDSSLKDHVMEDLRSRIPDAD